MFEKINFPLYFQKGISPEKGIFFGAKKSEKGKHPKICLSLNGNMPEAHI